MHNLTKYILSIVIELRLNIVPDPHSIHELVACQTNLETQLAQAFAGGKRRIAALHASQESPDIDLESRRSRMSRYLEGWQESSRPSMSLASSSHRPYPSSRMQLWWTSWMTRPRGGRPRPPRYCELGKWGRPRPWGKSTAPQCLAFLASFALQTRSNMWCRRSPIRIATVGLRNDRDLDHCFLAFWRTEWALPGSEWCRSRCWRWSPSAWSNSTPASHGWWIWLWPWPSRVTWQKWPTWPRWTSSIDSCPRPYRGSCTPSQCNQSGRSFAAQWTNSFRRASRKSTHCVIGSSGRWVWQMQRLWWRQSRAPRELEIFSWGKNSAWSILLPRTLISQKPLWMHALTPLLVVTPIVMQNMVRKNMAMEKETL